MSEDNTTPEPRTFDPRDLKLAKLAAKNEPRHPQLCGVLVEPDGTFVATNDRRLAALLATPESLGQAPARDERVVVSREAAAEVAKVKAGTPVQLDTSGDAPVFRVHGGAVLPAPLLDDPEQFPDWRQVVPKGDPDDTFAINAKCLKEACEVALDTARRHGDKPGEVMLHVFTHGKRSAVRLEVRFPDGAVLLQLIMPMRS